MADKDKLASMLGGGGPKQQIRRGPPVRLSTEDAPAAEAHKRTNAQTQNSEIAVSQKRTNAETQSSSKRVNRGYMLREDLIKACKLLAVREDRNLYEVMEAALEQYLAQHEQA